MSEKRTHKIHYYNQIARFDGKNVFVEVLNNTFHLGKGKVMLNFIKYNEKGVTDKIDIYIDIQKAVVLCQDILSGKLARNVRDAQATKMFENKPVSPYTSYFTSLGGQNEARAGRADGMALSKQFKIQAGTRVPWVLRAETGPGKSSDTGLIVPSGKAEQYINVALQDEDLKALALLLDKHINAYINHVYTDHAKDFYPNERINIFKADPSRSQNK